MRILVAPDKFKGCLSAQELAKEIEAGVRETLPGAHITVAPVADGGDGTAEVICAAAGGSWVECRVHDPLGRQIEARYALINDQELAVIEMSEAAGMRRLTDSDIDPLRATTFGVGQLVMDAARRGVAEIVVGLGGSATNDGGFGLARALGYRFFDGEGMQIRSAVNKLRTLKIIESPRNLALPPIIAAADVQNKLYGRHGATRVFGAQKGAARPELALLEKCMKRLARIAGRQVRAVNPRTPGAGAAGGLGFGLMAFAGARICRGFDLVSRLIGLEADVADADAVITGEGTLDAQTLDGKAPVAVAELARKHGKPIFAIVGQWRDEQKTAGLFDAVYALTADETDTSGDIPLARELLRKRAAEMAKEWQLSIG